MSCCCVFLETLRTLNMQSLTRAKKEWVTKLVDSMFLLERGKGVPEMINTCSIMSASFMATWVSSCSHRERANLKAAIVVGKSECLRIKEPKTRRAQSGRVAGSVETGYNVMPENFWFPTGSAALQASHHHTCCWGRGSGVTEFAGWASLHI